MYKLKIAVYGICKNESNNIPHWAVSAKQADYRVIADTGSSDDSISVALMWGVAAMSIVVRPFRFDMAFNAALAALPEDVDICIPLGLDEVLEPGWREHLEKAWTPGATKCYVTYHQHFPDGGTLTFQNDRPHARFGYTWRFPCHEQTYPYLTTPFAVNAPDMVISHHQARKDRSQYLHLLQTGVKENPNNPRMLHYCGREFYYYKMYLEAIPYLEQYRKIQFRASHPIEYDENDRILKECQAMTVATLQQP